jgi:pyridoxal 5'-phosphate synthase pdxT subunit
LTRVGVLALQGAFREHVQTLNRIGVETVEVRLPRDLEGCDGLILPGGETTTQRKLAKAFGLWELIRNLGRQGLPMLATCAGLILLSRGVEDGEGVASLRASEEEPSLGLLNVDVVRNAYGRQVHSFEARMRIPCLESVSLDRAPFVALFIRAPVIRRTGPGVSILGVWEGSPVAVQQGNVLGLTFHPELTRDDRFHLYFLNRIQKNRRQPQPMTLATGRT